MEKPKVSVIVPIFHSEAYLERCCISLFCQTLDLIEFIFILDGPSDEAEQLISTTLAEYPGRSEFVQIIKHSHNQGISFSRQEGHDHATGEYLFHCDSDDWLEPAALSHLYDKAKESALDILFFDYYREYKDSGHRVMYSSASVLSGAIISMDAPLHNKLIKKELLIKHSLHFPIGINWGEDLCMSVLCQIHAQRIGHLPQAFYHCNIHSDSFTAQPNRNKYDELVKCPQYIENELQKVGLKEKYTRDLLQMKFEVKEYYLINPSLRDLSRWLTIYPECHTQITSYIGVPIYLKIVSILVVHHMNTMANLLLHLRDGISALLLKLNKTAKLL